jgi:putative ABC transport system ATP-binding protein
MSTNIHKKNIIEATNIRRTYVSGTVETEVLRGIDFSVREGEFVAIMGRSGAGKSTLMYQLSLLDQPTAGTISIDGQRVSNFTQRERTTFRLEELGYVFQDYALVPELTAVENVSLQLMMQGRSFSEARVRAEAVLADFGLLRQKNNLPSQLSGGEQQRVSLARAIAHKPKIIFADEPTANLDLENAQNVMKMLKDLNAQGQTIIMVTHEEEYGKMADRIVTIVDGLTKDA